MGGCVRVHGTGEGGSVYEWKRRPRQDDQRSRASDGRHDGRRRLSFWPLGPHDGRRGGGGGRSHPRRETGPYPARPPDGGPDHGRAPATAYGRSSAWSFYNRPSSRCGVGWSYAVSPVASSTALVCYERSVAAVFHTTVPSWNRHHRSARSVCLVRSSRSSLLSRYRSGRGRRHRRRAAAAASGPDRSSGSETRRRRRRNLRVSVLRGSSYPLRGRRQSAPTDPGPRPHLGRWPSVVVLTPRPEAALKEVGPTTGLRSRHRHASPSGWPDAPPLAGRTAPGRSARAGQDSRRGRRRPMWTGRRSGGARPLAPTTARASSCPRHDVRRRARTLWSPSFTPVAGRSRGPSGPAPHVRGGASTARRGGGAVEVRGDRTSDQRQEVS